MQKRIGDLGRQTVKPKVGTGNAAAVVRPRPRQMPTSILWDPAIVNKLRSKARKRGIGYQTMLKIIVAEHVDKH